MAYMSHNQHSILIDKLGGTREVARLCEVSSQAVSKWRREGIPAARLMFLRVVRPAVFGLPVPVAAATGRPVQVLMNMFNANSFESAPPADLLLDVVEVVQARRALNVLAGAFGMMLAPIPGDEADEASDAMAFQSVVHEVGGVLSVGTQALADGRIDACEREDIVREVSELIGAAQSFMSRLQG